MAAADDFYLKHGYGGHFGGRTLIQAHGKIGGHRSVFINLVSGNKDAFVYLDTVDKRSIACVCSVPYVVRIYKCS